MAAKQYVPACAGLKAGEVATPFVSGTGEPRRVPDPGAQVTLSGPHTLNVTDPVAVPSAALPVTVAASVSVAPAVSE